MKLRKQIARILAGVAAAVLLATPMTAYADSKPIENNKDGVIATVYKDRNNAPIKGMRVRIYKVASVEGEIRDGAASGYEVTYTVTSAFKKFDETTGTTRITGFSEEKLNEALKIRDGESVADRRARWQKIAASLEPYAVTGVMPTGDRHTDDNGEVRFTALSPGLYLLVADGKSVQDGTDDYRYTYDATFVALPGFAGGVWDYGIDLNFSEENAQLRPKYSYTPEPFEYTVYKRWVGDETLRRPVEVPVDIYCDDTYIETVELKESNGWRYTWSGGKSHKWRVIERASGNNYSVTLTGNLVTGEFTITNTYNPPPPPDNPPPPPPPENPPPEEPPEVLGRRREPEVLGARRREAVLGARRLPQSGQLWWPVPVLAIAGVALFAAGAAKRRREE